MEMMEKIFGIRKVVLPVIFAVLIFSSCNDGNRFHINGTVPDKSYDGEWIYLVPLVNAPVERVDSTVIQNAAFSFSGKVKDPEIYVIRTRPLIRLSLQELLVVKEPGNIRAKIGSSSIVTGTALNDSLQSWKEKKELFDYNTRMLDQKYSAATEEQRDSILPFRQELASARNNYYFEFAKNNQENVVGELVIRMMKATFTPEQQKELGIQDQ